MLIYLFFGGFQFYFIFCLFFKWILLLSEIVNVVFGGEPLGH